MAEIAFLERAIYGMSQVDRILGLRPGTARRWIDGYERGGRSYPPVVRLEQTGADVVTWGEFVETRLLAGYRGRNVSMHRMRPAVVRLRELLGVRYPLAAVRPLIHQRDLVYRVQQEVGLGAALSLFEVAKNGQLLPAAALEWFEQSSEVNDEGEVVRVRPLGPGTEVVIDPLRQFGEPVVRNVRTELIAEQFRAGDPVAAIAETYELTEAQVEAALRYEMQTSPEAA